VRTSLVDFCPVSQPIDQGTQTVFVESSIRMADEERSVRLWGDAPAQERQSVRQLLCDAVKPQEQRRYSAKERELEH